MSLQIGIAAGVLTAAAVGLLFTYEHPPIDVVQRGYRGTGMDLVYNPRRVETQIAANQVPEVVDPVDPAGQPSSAAYQNVKVLGDVDANEFLRLMTAITQWVSPEQGCAYCHTEDGNFASDALYTKIVARRMLQMTRKINAGWKSHVAGTGVTCYACHRGQPVPQAIWFTQPDPVRNDTMAGNKAGQNLPAAATGLASLPYDPFTPFLEQAQDIRVNSKVALPEGNRHSIKQTEWTYALMVHMSRSLGVNCTYCHNSRQFASWEQSSPARVTAWYGIRMVRDLNNDYLGSLQHVFPHARLGPLGDTAKVNCTTCHQGVYKPLYGAGMLKDYPELAGPAPGPGAWTPAEWKPGPSASAATPPFKEAAASPTAALGK